MSVKSHRVQQAVQSIVGSAAHDALGAHLKNQPGASMVEQVLRQFELWCGLMEQAKDFWELRASVQASLAWLGYGVEPDPAQAALKRACGIVLSLAQGNVITDPELRDQRDEQLNAIAMVTKHLGVQHAEAF